MISIVVSALDSKSIVLGPAPVLVNLHFYFINQKNFTSFKSLGYHYGALKGMYIYF